MENKKILRFDIETASEVYTEGERFAYPKRKLWEQKMEGKQESTTLRNYLHNCGIYSEFSKVVCISMMVGDKVSSITGEEEEILEKFNEVLEKSD
ncbi:MAG: hypothetical protein LBG52_05870 [Candidatus Peribacteria bacterium]|jgi:hypothetical protein|nr:hypothetical protein [Candidatus Peribacteria bacterium]